MSDATANGADTPQQQPVKMQILGQFIRDMSFENVAAQKGLEGEIQPEMNVQVSLDARKRRENDYEVATKLTVTAVNKEDKANLFLLELDYAGVFRIENVPDEQMHPFLLIECPRMTFPFVRRIVNDVTRDGGMMPVNLDTIDFVQLYRNELMRRAQSEGDQPAQA